MFRLTCRWTRIRGVCSDYAAAAISAAEARQIFLDYFVSGKGHTYVRSSPVVASGDDPSLLFTNAGMNQFKSVLLGGGFSGGDLCTAANSQKCVRVGGKHNDLDDVGRDGHHHTFFEMLGSWSFGHYFKEEACRMAWELLTGPLRIPAYRLYVTYFGGDPGAGLEPDNECRDVWLRIGVSPDRVLPFGSKDNFWEMGNTGPCGPCTEIHYSHVTMGDGETASHLVNAGLSDVIELWNLVFVQYNRLADGSLNRLAKFHVDTGMGLERLAAVLRGSASNYDTDLFAPLFGAIHKESGCRPYEGRFGANDRDGVDTAYRILADHARMCAVSIADGLCPDEYGAGHCLRRVIRRAVAASRMTLKAPDGLLAKLLPHVAASLGNAFPEVSVNLVKSVDIVREEEDKFLRILGKGLRLFEEMCSQQNLQGVFSAESMWSLFFVHGLPEDLILDLCASRGLTVDLDGFRSLLANEKAKSVDAFRCRNQSETRFQFSQKAVEFLLNMGIPKTDDSFKYDVDFYDNVLRVPKFESRVLAIWDGDKCENDIVPSPKTVGLILNQTNFYSEAGGQSSDVGFIETKDSVFKVEDVQNLNGYVVHRGTLLEGHLHIGTTTILNVDEPKRSGCTRNHTATHLLQAALRKVLGGETSQKSSFVTADYLRFDFSVKSPLKKDDFQRIQSLVREAIGQKLSVRRVQLSATEASDLPNLVRMMGAVYPDPLTVIVVNPSGPETASSLSNAVSLEPCCGTHVTNTEDLMDFVILSQKSLSQVMRSIRAVTGVEASKAKLLGLQIEKDVDRLATAVSDLEAGGNANYDVYQDLGAARAMAAKADIPLIARLTLDDRIAGLKQRIAKVIRQQARSELTELLNVNQGLEYLVHWFHVGGNDSVVFSEVAKMTPTLPSCVFVTLSGVVHYQCRIPKNLVTNTFNARTWATAVLAVLGGTERRSSSASSNSMTVVQLHDGDARRSEAAFRAALHFIQTRSRLKPELWPLPSSS